MCQNKFIQTEEQFNDLVLLFQEIHGSEWTNEEILQAASDYARYFNSNRDVRTAHTDITSDCMFYFKKDDETPRSANAQKARARKNLEELVKKAKPFGAKWHVAHLCEHGSQCDAVCVNPLHLYFATPKENHRDFDRHGNPTGAMKSIETNRKNKTGSYHNPELRKKAASLGGKAGATSQLKSGNHNTKLKNKTCQYCYKKTTAIHINRHEIKCAREKGYSSHTPRPTRTDLNPATIYFHQNLNQ